MSPNQLFAEGISKLSSIQTAAETTEYEKNLAEGLIRTLSSLHSEILSLKEQVQTLQDK